MVSNISGFGIPIHISLLLRLLTEVVVVSCWLFCPCPTLPVVFSQRWLMIVEVVFSDVHLAPVAHCRWCSVVPGSFLPLPTIWRRSDHFALGLTCWVVFGYSWTIMPLPAVVCLHRLFGGPCLVLHMIQLSVYSICTILPLWTLNTLACCCCPFHVLSESFWCPPKVVPPVNFVVTLCYKFTYKLSSSYCWLYFGFSVSSLYEPFLVFQLPAERPLINFDVQKKINFNLK